MSKAMTKLATLLLDEPLAPLELSITELAEQAGTSAATVTRFCRLIGYSGYVQFRVGVASRCRARGCPPVLAGGHRPRIRPGRAPRESAQHAAQLAHPVAAVDRRTHRPRPGRRHRQCDQQQRTPRHLRHRRERWHGRRDAEPSLPDRHQRPLLGRGARRPHQCGDPRQGSRRHRHLQHGAHRGDDPDALPGEVVGGVHDRAEQQRDSPLAEVADVTSSPPPPSCTSSRTTSPPSTRSSSCSTCSTFSSPN